MLQAIPDAAVEVLEQIKAVLDHLVCATQFLQMTMGLGAIAYEVS